MKAQKLMHFGRLLFFTLAVFLTIGCDKETGLNFFTLEQDREFGETMDSVITADRTEFPILDPVVYSEVYVFMNTMMAEILQSDDFAHKDDFDWKITIIEKDVMNAFAVPGGKLYFYTGLMKYLDNEANLAGVLAHEMVHADRRHSTEQITTQYTFSTLLSILIGNDKSKYEEIAIDLGTGITELQFSKKHETEADEYSVRFLADTKYHPKGVSGFFEKLLAEGKSGSNFTFLSTHPSDQVRIDNINAIWQGMGSPDGEYFQEEYEIFKTSLP